MSVSACVAVAAVASVTCTVKLNVPDAVGVPASTPPVVRVSPAGTCPATTDHVYGLVPDAADSSVKYSTPTVPSAKLVVVTDTALMAVMLARSLQDTIAGTWGAARATPVPAITPAPASVHAVSTDAATRQRDRTGRRPCGLVETSTEFSSVITKP